MRRSDDLTHREQEVFDLLRRGLTNEEIAHRLGISLDGAKYHVSQILSKLGVATREEAAGVALGEGRRWYWKLAWIGGVGVTAAALAGLGVLAWGAAATSLRSSQVCAVPDDIGWEEADREVLAKVENLDPGAFGPGSVGIIYGDFGGATHFVTTGELPPLTLDEVNELIDTGEVASLEIGDTGGPPRERRLYAYRDPVGEIHTWLIAGEQVRVVTHETLQSQVGSDMIWYLPHPVLCETGTVIDLSSESVEQLIERVRRFNSRGQGQAIQLSDNRGRQLDWTPAPPTISPTP